MSSSRTRPPISAGRLARRALPVLAVLALTLVLAGCVTDPPTSVSGTGATLNGRFNPLNAPAVGYFEYGTTTSYGSETSPRVDLGSGAANIALSRRVTGLTPNTEYHYRACQIREGAKTCGADRTFRTTSDRLPAGFEEVIAFEGLNNPTALRFAADGRVFVAERSGLIKVFDGLDDPTASVFADLRTKVHAFWDRGLLGLALDPAFPARPFVYVAYAHDAVIGGNAPRWGVAGATSDTCPTPPGPTADGCVISGRVSRLTADGETPVPEQVLVEDWCQQFPSHSVGSLAFGPDGALYASGGDGASFNAVDYGQFGSPRNPCGDPPGDVGDTLTPPSAEGGALRSQDLRSAGDPASLGGTIIRIDPETGEGLPGNPGAASADRNVRRIVAQGLRNPMRITTRPGTGELWVGDVGWGEVEEVNRLTSPTDGVVDNFGWPCYEGPGRQGSYDAANLSLCEALYTSGTHSAPHFSYRHSDPVVPGEQCGVGSSSITGVAFGFYGGGPYPAAYDGALFFADYSRNCIWMLPAGAGTLPNGAARTTFVERALSPVDLQISPSGELFYADFGGGTIRRIVYSAGNRPPVAVASADRTSGGLPLTVQFDGSTSDDPDSAAPLAFAWDLDGDGQFDDSNAERPSYTYTQAGTYTTRLRVTDGAGSSATDAVAISAGNTPPTATISSPSPGRSWKVGDTISFAGAASDEQQGTLPDSALSFALTLRHCPAACHSHPVGTWPGTAAGSFVAPDHEYPSHLELSLTATDAGGLADTQTVRLDPRTVSVTMRSDPAGLSLALGPSAGPAPFTRSLIEGSTTTIAAPSPQNLAGTPFVFGFWSDGGAQSHTVTVPGDREYTATYSSP